MPAQFSRSGIERANRAVGLLADQRANSSAAHDSFRRPRLDLAGALYEIRSCLVRAHVEKPCDGAIRWGRPIDAAREAGVDQRSRAEGRLLIGREDRAAVRIEPLGPRFFHEGNAGDEFAVRAIEDVIETVAIREADELALLPIDLRVEENGRLIRIPIVIFVRRVLEIPFQLAGVGIDRDQRSRYKDCRPGARRR